MTASYTTEYFINLYETDAGKSTIVICNHTRAVYLKTAPF